MSEAGTLCGASREEGDAGDLVKSSKAESAGTGGGGRREWKVVQVGRRSKTGREGVN